MPGENFFKLTAAVSGSRAISQETPKPIDNKDEAWVNLDDLVKIWIYGTITQSLLNMILKSDQELQTLTLGDLTISQYCERMKAISNFLNNIRSPVLEPTFVAYLINGLSPKYDNITTVLCHQDPLPYFLKCRSILSLEERTLNRNRTTQPLHMDHASSPIALLSEALLLPNHVLQPTTTLEVVGPLNLIVVAHKPKTSAAIMLSPFNHN
ncbi:unnamed protein product [Lactuca virosa]|uniref:Uncharacterized protein n=1 Tax=Lactuca virosa TaxID=75947 RepID=A0AAU9NJM2_9ASTR|nr:unnamed protein product [Lactuca virosa]